MLTDKIPHELIYVVSRIDSDEDRANPRCGPLEGGIRAVQLEFKVKTDEDSQKRYLQFPIITPTRSPLLTPISTMPLARAATCLSMCS